ncbi:MAG: hypothetical protein EPO67_10365 [Reyranella sp.]|nr:MAG: hypothetical protein EPO67_10365 [Reyranella sp.]
MVLVAQLAACAGRDAAIAQPVAMPADQQLNCEALYAEIVGNNAKVASLQSEESSKRGQNIAMGVVGAVLFWPALFAMDFKDAAGTDRKAVEARLAYLNSLYGAKSCASTTGPIPAAPSVAPTTAPELKPAAL